MRTSISLLLTAMAFAVISTAQPPQAFKYQAVVRDASGQLVCNQNVSIRFKILDGGPSGTQVFLETHSCTTNDFGLVNLDVGGGNVQYGSIEGVDWASGSKYLKVECDPTGGTSYIGLGTTELKSVPYALYSETSSDSYWEKLNDNVYYTNGNVGVGTDNPLNDFHVYGAGLFKKDGPGLAISPTTDHTQLVFVSSGGGSYVSARFKWAQTELTGKVGINESDPVYPLHVKSSTSGTWIAGFHNTNTGTTSHGVVVRADGGDPFLVQHSTSNLLYVKANGFIGIGTTSLSNARLTIEGPGAYDAMVKINNTGTDGADFFMGSTNSAWGGGVNANRFVMGHGAPSSANIDLCIMSTGAVGIGTLSPITALEVAPASGSAIYGHSSASTGIWGSSSSSYGIYGQSQTGIAGYFSGNVLVTGSLGKGSGSFIIDHPLDPANKLLRHNFVESPENLLIYRGKAKLDSKGEAMIPMPDYFIALTKEDDASIHLTPVGRPFLTGAEWNSDFSGIIVYGDANREVFWEVLADRDDPVIHELDRPVEEEKGQNNPICDKGKLLYPKAYGYPESAGRDYEMSKIGRENDHPVMTQR